MKALGAGPLGKEPGASLHSSAFKKQEHAKCQALRWVPGIGSLLLSASVLGGGAGKCSHGGTEGSAEADQRGAHTSMGGKAKGFWLKRPPQRDLRRRGSPVPTFFFKKNPHPRLCFY